MTLQAKSFKGSSKKRGKLDRFKLNNSENNQIILFEIALEMKKAKLPKAFIVSAVKTALDFEGIADLMRLWHEETDQNEKNEIVADIQDMLDACAQKEVKDDFYIKFSDLEKIAQNIRAFKDSLLEVVMQRGGISSLAEATGIPQPSLSRFFNSNSMPHRSTLLKLAKALNLDGIKMESFSSFR